MLVFFCDTDRFNVVYPLIFYMIGITRLRFYPSVIVSGKVEIIPALKISS